MLTSAPRSGAAPVSKVGGSAPPITTAAGSRQCEVKVRYRSSLDVLSNTPAPLCNLAPRLLRRMVAGSKPPATRAILFQPASDTAVRPVRAARRKGIGVAASLDHRVAVIW